MEDSYLKSRLTINMKGVAIYDFSIDNNAASKAEDRFRLIFESVGGPLPVTFININAAKKEKT